MRAGDHAAAAWDLAVAAELINRQPGLMATPTRADEAAALLTRARVLAAGDPVAEARVLTAEAYTSDDIDPAKRAGRR